MLFFFLPPSSWLPIYYCKRYASSAPLIKAVVFWGSAFAFFHFCDCTLGNIQMTPFPHLQGCYFFRSVERGKERGAAFAAPQCENVDPFFLRTKRRSMKSVASKDITVSNTGIPNASKEKDLPSSFKWSVARYSSRLAANFAV